MRQVKSAPGACLLYVPRSMCGNLWSIYIYDLEYDSFRWSRTCSSGAYDIGAYGPGLQVTAKLKKKKKWVHQGVAGYDHP